MRTSNKDSGHFLNKSSASFIAAFLVLIVASIGILTGLSAYSVPVAATFSAAVRYIFGI